MNVGWEARVRDPARLEALEKSGLVGSGPEDAFDRLIELAADLVGINRGSISLVDAQSTTAKSSVGFPEGLELFLPIELSFCRFVVASGQPFIVNDANEDPRTSGDPAVELFAKVAWAGYPIEDGDGHVLGTFSLMDVEPHEWTARDLHILATLAAAASTEIARRRSAAEAIEARREANEVRSRVERQRVALVEHLNNLMTLDESTAQIARSILTRVNSADD
jgi:GAF domain-containing protein